MKNSNYILSESPLWVERNNAWFFVDINTGHLFRQKNGSHVCGPLSSPSNVIEVSKNRLLITCANEFLVLGLESGKTISINQFFNEAYRCNDGSIGPDGNYWFGTMEKSPCGLNGRLYSMDSKGDLVDQGAQIGIPNTFIWLNDQSVLISDSFLQKTYKVELLTSGKLDWANREVWLDLSNTDATPDGGALDDEGNIWIAVWGDASIHRYSPDGFLLEKLELEALQPTSCAFGGISMDEMLITTATEGMTSEQLRQYPDSGKVILRKMGVKGKVLPVFDLEV